MIIAAVVSSSVIPRMLACIIIMIVVLLAVCYAIFKEWVMCYTLDPNLKTPGGGSRLVVFADVLGTVSGAVKLVEKTGSFSKTAGIASPPSTSYSMGRASRHEHPDGLGRLVLYDPVGLEMRVRVAEHPVHPVQRAGARRHAVVMVTCDGPRTAPSTGTAGPDVRKRRGLTDNA